MKEGSTVFEALDMAPADVIMGLNEAFKKDPNPKKINLTIGVFKDDHGATPILSCVKKAEERLLKEETSKGYLSIEGAPEQAAVVQDLLFGSGSPIIGAGRAATAQTPGGTGALRVGADFLGGMKPNATVWLSDPTWPNHPSIFEAAGLKVKTYPYYDAATRGLAFDAMTAALKEVPAGDFVLFHGCCHNPSGMDPDPAQWKTLREIAKERQFIPFFDFAYQGFADGIEEDATGLRAFCEAMDEMLIASSFSKNFGLYNERVGALTLVGKDAADAEKALSHLKRAIRSNYSNPPAHGGAIVSTILKDAQLRAEWEAEVKAMRDRIKRMRVKLVEGLKAAGVEQDFSFLIRQKGMFSFSGLTQDQVKRLREEFSIYIVGNGRINVAALTDDKIDPLCAGIAAVLA